MTDIGNTIEIANIGNKECTASLVYREKERSFGFKISRKSWPYKFLQFFPKYRIFWADMYFMGATLQESDFDFYNAFSDDIDRVIKTVTYVADWYGLPKISKLEDLLIASVDDGREKRYVI